MELGLRDKHTTKYIQMQIFFQQNISKHANDGIKEYWILNNYLKH